MRVDDLATWFLGTGALNTCIAALSTVGIPLTSLTAGQIITRDFVEPAQAVTLFLDPQPEEVEPFSTTTDLVTEKVEAYFFVSRGATESVARDQAKLYADALLNCLAAHPDYMGFESREYYDGVEGKPDIKASRVLVVFKYEE